MKGFRVYDKDIGQYVTDELYWLVESNGELKALEDGDLIGFPHCVKEDETGLRDKNGKKIFEGDIIEVYTLDTNNARRAVCLYGEFRDEEDELYLGWYGHYSGAERTFDFSLVQEDKTLMGLAEIIGNIHDNPELLEE